MRPMTKYFQEQILIKRSYLKMEWVEHVIQSPVRKESQHDGRIKLWGFIQEEKKYLRVILLTDGATVHNAFFDRDFNKEGLKR